MQPPGRPVRRRVAVAAVAGLVAVGAFAVPLLKADREPRPAAVDYAPAVSPPRRALPLPSGRIGLAAFVYAPCPRTCGPLLVLRDGKQYALPRAGRGEPTAGYTLSPDGRWLGQPAPGGFRMRDLSGIVSYHWTDPGPGVSDVWAWSPDSRWLLLVHHVDGAVDHFETINLRSGARRRSTGAGLVPLAVFDDGTVAHWSPDGQRLIRVDVSSGGSSGVTIVREIHPDLRSLLLPGERVRPESLQVDPSGGFAALTIAGPAPDDLGPARGVLLMELVFGHWVNRLELPAAAGGDALDRWEPRTFLAGGLLVVHWRADRTELVQLNPVSGGLAVVSRLPRDAAVVVRGDTG